MKNMGQLVNLKRALEVRRWANKTLVNASGTVSLAHIKYLDKKYFEGKTGYCVSCINDYMIKEAGEPLFYLI